MGHVPEAMQVQSGVARTGKWWGHQHFEDAKPDIMLFAKGIGSGYPFAGIAAKPHLYDNLRPGTMGAPRSQHCCLRLRAVPEGRGHV